MTDIHVVPVVELNENLTRSKLHSLSELHRLSHLAAVDEPSPLTDQVIVMLAVRFGNLAARCSNNVFLEIGPRD